MITNLIRRDIARARRSCSVLHHTAASIKLYTLTYSLLKRKITAHQMNANFNFLRSKVSELFRSFQTEHLTFFEKSDNVLFE